MEHSSEYCSSQIEPDAKNVEPEPEQVFDLSQRNSGDPYPEVAHPLGMWFALISPSIVEMLRVIDITVHADDYYDEDDVWCDPYRCPATGKTINRMRLRSHVRDYTDEAFFQRANYVDYIAFIRAASTDILPFPMLPYETDEFLQRCPQFSCAAGCMGDSSHELQNGMEVFEYQIQIRATGMNFTVYAVSHAHTEHNPIDADLPIMFGQVIGAYRMLPAAQ
jgi:hypothetical protein